MRSFLRVAIIAISLSLSACMDSQIVYAPVSDASTIDPIPNNGKHRIHPGETLYSTAWRYGQDYHYLAKINHIAPPYHVYAGQVIYFQNKPTSIKLAKTTVEPEATETVVTAGPVNHWLWPAHGAVIGTFSEFNKGINIKGRVGDPVYATAAGKVVYSGSGLRGYGNLIIIEHNNIFLTAYAHNKLLLVKEGNRVKSGQKIAEMGKTGARQVMLHFEIRRSGQPVNPLNYLAGSQE